MYPSPLCQAEYTQSGQARQAFKLSLLERRKPVVLGPKGTFPNVVALANGHALVAWEDEGVIRVQALP